MVVDGLGDALALLQGLDLQAKRTKRERLGAALRAHANQCALPAAEASAAPRAPRRTCSYIRSKFWASGARAVTPFSLRPLRSRQW